VGRSLSDASVAIYSAAQNIFGDKYTHGTCSVHFKRNVEKRIMSFVPLESRKLLREDLDFLKNIHEIGLFEKAIFLFKNELEDDIPEFVEYFFET